MTVDISRGTSRRVTGKTSAKARWKVGSDRSEITVELHLRRSEDIESLQNAQVTVEFREGKNLARSEPTPLVRREIGPQGAAKELMATVEVKLGWPIGSIDDCRTRLAVIDPLRNAA